MARHRNIISLETVLKYKLLINTAAVPTKTTQESAELGYMQIKMQL